MSASNLVVLECRRRTLDALEKDAAKVWCELPYEYREDKEFILRALKSPALPPKSDFERRFPQRLRFDKEVVLAFCARSDFYDLYQERHLYVPGCLIDDKDVMLAYCQKIPRSLQECSEELCDDRDVVLAAIQLDGMELQYASRSLQEDRDMVVAACQKDGRALEFCPPGPVRTELVLDRQFILGVLRRDGGPMLRLVPEPMRHDRLLLLEALQHGMRFRYCPSEFQMDGAFVAEALARKAALYLELNRDMQAQISLAYAAVCSPNSTPVVQRRVLQQFPELASRRAVALAICQHGDVADVKQFIAAADCPSEFKNDREIMFMAIRRDSKLFVHASPRLKQDTEIIMAAMDEESAADVLAAVGHEALRQNPQIVVRAVSVYPVRHMRLLWTHIPEELWTHHRPLAVAFIIRNGRVSDAFEHMLQADRELALLVAEHAWQDFVRVGEPLKNDLEFMKQAVDRNGLVFQFASPELQQTSLDLVVRAVANHPHAILHTNPRNNAAASAATTAGTTTATARNANNNVGIGDTNQHRRNNNGGGGWNSEQIKQVIQQKLDLHQLFVEEFLRGIAIARPHLPPAQRSSLAMLDRGFETSQAFKCLIAEFLGVPIGAELKRLRKAMINLTQPIPETANHHSRETHMYRLADRQQVPHQMEPQLQLQALGLFVRPEDGAAEGGAADEEDPMPHPFRRRRRTLHRVYGPARLGGRGHGGPLGPPPPPGVVRAVEGGIHGPAAAEVVGRHHMLRSAREVMAREVMEEMEEEYGHPFAQPFGFPPPHPAAGDAAAVELEHRLIDLGLFEGWDMGAVPDMQVPALEEASATLQRAAGYNNPGGGRAVAIDHAENIQHHRAAAVAINDHMQQQRDADEEQQMREEIMMMEQEDV